MNRAFPALVLSLAMLPLGLHAQDQQPAPRSPEAVVIVMASKLNLTSDQQAKINPIIADRQQKLQTLRGESSERPRKRMREARVILEKSDKQINKILMPDQRRTYQQMEDARIEQIRANRKNGDGADVLWIPAQTQRPSRNARAFHRSEERQATRA